MSTREWCCPKISMTMVKLAASRGTELPEPALLGLLLLRDDRLLDLDRRDSRETNVGGQEGLD